MVKPSRVILYYILNRKILHGYYSSVGQLVKNPKELDECRGFQLGLDRESFVWCSFFNTRFGNQSIFFQPKSYRNRLYFPSLFDSFFRLYCLIFSSWTRLKWNWRYFLAHGINLYQSRWLVSYISGYFIYLASS